MDAGLICGFFEVETVLQHHPKPASRRMNRTIVLLTLVIVCLSLLGLEGCSPFAPAPRKPAPGEVPPTFSNSNEASPLVMHWWEAFGSSQLNALIQEALSSNFSLQQSWARLKQAEALAVQSGAALVPELSFEGSATSGRQHTADGTISNTEGTEISCSM